MIVCCDNLKLLTATADESIDLIYVDPPFGTGRRRRTTTATSSYADTTSHIGEAIDFLQPRVQDMHRVLKPSGTIYVHLDWRIAHAVHVLHTRLQKIELTAFGKNSVEVVGRTR